MDRRQVLTRGAVVMTAPLLCAQPAHALTATIGATTVRFATVAQGRAVLGADDDWIAAAGAFHRAAIVGAPSPVSRERLRAFCADAVLPWTAALEVRWQQALVAIAPRFKALRVPLPPEVLLIHTNGREAANAPHTRANAVAMPVATMPEGAGVEAALMAHELFHIVSRYSPALATKLYALLGFEPVAPLQWPAEWLELRIANPDATHDRHAMRTTFQGRAVTLIPLLVANRTELKPGETFFSVLDVRLLEVTTGDATLPVRQNGQPVWHAPQDVPDYLARLGGNTGYIIHPEETMADNFALLVTGRPARNPELVKRVESVLLAQP